MKRRKRYEVKEVVIYEVLAHSEEEAEQIIEASSNRDKFCVAVTDRDAYLKLAV